MRLANGIVRITLAGKGGTDRNGEGISFEYKKAADYIELSDKQRAGYFDLSRPDRKFRFQPSRKFLLTTARLKDGTNRDEPRGTR